MSGICSVIEEEEKEEVEEFENRHIIEIINYLSLFLKVAQGIHKIRQRAT